MKPQVSVVIPTYNHATFLGRALQSVLSQTYPHWEALVVDNHSQDHTDDVITSFDDSRIRLFKIHNHGAIAASRNLGMRNAGGKWIAFLDADDCWYPKKLQVIVEAAQESDAYDVLSNDELMVDARTGARRVLRHGPYEEDFYRALLVEGNRLSTSAVVVRREFVFRHGLVFDESQDCITVEDYDFWLNLARLGARFKFIHDVQGEFVVHGTNSSAQLDRHLRNGEMLLRDHVFRIQQFQPSKELLWKQIAARLRLWEARQFVINHRFGPAFTLALKALIDSPSGTGAQVLSKLKRMLRTARA